VHSYELHCPYSPPPEQRERYLSWYDGDRERIECRDVSHGEISDLTYLRSLYAGSVAFADEFVGRLVAKLESLGRMEDTLIILTSDHGEQLGEDDGYVGHNRFHRNVMRVPLIVFLPGAALSKVEGPVSGIDLLPTIYAAFGLESPYALPGENLLPLVRGEGGISRERIRFAHEELAFAVYDGEWQLESWWEGREKLARWRGAGAGSPEHAPDLAKRMRDAHAKMVDRHRDLRDHFRVVREVGKGRDGESEQAREAARALGYID